MVLRHSTPTTHSVVQWRGQQRLCGRQGLLLTARDVLTDATVGTIFGAGGKIIGAGLSSLTSSVSKQATSKLTQLASKVIANMGAGKGPVYGTKVHSAFCKIANGMKIGKYTIRTEVSYLNGNIVKYGTKDLLVLMLVYIIQKVN